MGYAYFCSWINNTFNTVSVLYCTIQNGNSEVANTPQESRRSGDEARQAKLIVLFVHALCYPFGSWTLDLYLLENTYFVLNVISTVGLLWKKNIFFFVLQVAYQLFWV